jgi:hypothetical protein
MGFMRVRTTQKASLTFGSTLRLSYLKKYYQQFPASLTFSSALGDLINGTGEAALRESLTTDEFPVTSGALYEV